MLKLNNMGVRIITSSTPFKVPILYCQVIYVLVMRDPIALILRKLKVDSLLSEKHEGRAPFLSEGRWNPEP